MLSPKMITLLHDVAKSYLTRKKKRADIKPAKSYFKMRKQAAKTYRRIRIRTSEPIIKAK